MAVRIITPAAQGIAAPATASRSGLSSHEVSLVRQYQSTIQAGAGPRYESASSSSGIPDFELTSEQIEVDKHVEEVGWLGYYSAVVSTLASMVEIYPQRWNGTEWVDADGGLEHAQWRQFWKPASPMEALTHKMWMARDCELLLTLGEFAAWPHADDDGKYDGWYTAHPKQLTRGSRQGVFGAKMREDARPGGPGFVEAPTDRLARAWRPDRVWPDQAKVSLGRVLPEIRLFRSVVANLTRSSDSRLLMNGVFYIPTVEDDLALDDDGPQPDSSMPWLLDSDSAASPDGGGLSELLEAMARYARRAWNDPYGSDVAKAAPFPFPHHTKPEIIDLGHAVDKDTLATVAVIIESAARGIDIPMDFLTAGVGEANHWNSAEKRRALNAQAVFPIVEDYVGWWTRRFRVWLKHTGHVDPGNIRLWYNADAITIKPDNGAQILAAHKYAGFRREVIAEVVGLSSEDLSPLPEGMTEADFTMLTVGTDGESVAAAEGNAADVAAPKETSGTPAQLTEPMEQVTAAAIQLLA